MEQTKIAKQMVDFYKTSFDNTFNAMAMLQDQNEQMVNMFLAQATWLPEQGKKPIQDWVKTFKTGREQFKKTVEENFKKVEEFFSAAEKAAETTVKKATETVKETAAKAAAEPAKTK